MGNTKPHPITQPDFMAPISVWCLNCDMEMKLDQASVDAHLGHHTGIKGAPAPASKHPLDVNPPVPPQLPSPVIDYDRLAAAIVRAQKEPAATDPKEGDSAP
jgi:hypothetical protein